MKREARPHTYHFAGFIQVPDIAGDDEAEAHGIAAGVYGVAQALSNVVAFTCPAPTKLEVCARCVPPHLVRRVAEMLQADVDTLPKDGWVLKSTLERPCGLGSCGNQTLFVEFKLNRPPPGPEPKGILNA